MPPPIKTPLSSYSMATAELEWLQDDIPHAKDFSDVYFSKLQGLEETRYVFLQHNRLAQRWQQLAPQQTFTIAETGFGSGLNFLAAWQLWQKTARNDAHLLFFSVEKHPLKKSDLIRVLDVWSELKPLAEQLITFYPSLTAGQHLIQFPNSNVSLLLIFDDATAGLEQLRSSDLIEWQPSDPRIIDAWFLDGFTPTRNPQLWNEALYEIIADLSGAATTLTTFTASSAVRRELTQQGFTISKAPGFGTKREMLTGKFDPTAPRARVTTHNNSKSSRAPWYLNAATKHQQQHVTIIGGGLAGTTSANAMAKRGRKVTLIERYPALAQGASGNPQGMLYTKLSPQRSTLNDFYLSSYLFALRFYQQWQSTRNIPAQQLDFCGVLQLAYSDSQRKLMEQLHHTFGTMPNLVQFLSADEASERAGLTLEHPAWFFPQAGWLSPPALCASLAQHPNINLIHQHEVITLHAMDNGWVLNDAQGKTISHSDSVIIANSHDALAFTQTEQLPVKTIRGQITQLPAQHLPALKTVICHEGYITPAINGSHSLGATFDIGDHDIAVRSSDHQRNLNSQQAAIPALELDNIADIEQLTGRAALRCTSPDYLPLVGPVPIQDKFIEDFAALRKNAHTKIDRTGSYYPNLYLNIAHGSRGLTSTPLCSELLASMICQQLLPLPRQLVTGLNPGRFIIRDLIRNKL